MASANISEPVQNGQFDLFTARSLRDEGITKVGEHNDDWLEWCVSIVKNNFRRGTGEDIRVYCQALRLEPKHPNAWGALINVLVKRGLIQKTGEYRQMKDKRSHARETAVYSRVCNT